MPTDTPTPTPAEIALANADASREAFFAEASEAFDRSSAARAVALNPLADKLANAGITAALPSATDRPATPPAATAPSAASGALTPPRTPAASPAAPAPGAASVASIPGPPAAVVYPAAAAPPAASAPTPGQSDFSDLPGPDAWSKGAVKPDNWKRLHAKADTFATRATAAEQEVERLRQQLSSTTASTTPPPEFAAQLAALQKERDAVVQQLEAVAVERSPRFEQTFKPRLEAAIATARAAVGPDRADRVTALLQMPESAHRDEMIEAVIQDIGPTSLRAMKLTQAVADLDRVANERTALASQGSQLFKQWQAQEQQAQQRVQAERTAQVNQTFEKVVSDWRKAGADIDDTGLAIARDVYMGQRTLDDIAAAAMWVAVGPKAAANALKWQNRVTELETELARYRAVQPSAASDAGSAPFTATDDIPPNTSYADAIARLATQAGLLRR